MSRVEVVNYGTKKNYIKPTIFLMRWNFFSIIYEACLWKQKFIPSIAFFIFLIKTHANENAKLEYCVIFFINRTTKKWWQWTESTCVDNKNSRNFMRRKYHVMLIIVRTLQWSLIKKLQTLKIILNGQFFTKN